MRRCLFPNIGVGPKLSGMTMKAAVLDDYLAPFRVVDLPRPEAGPGQVLIRIKESGINPLDLKIRAGKAPHARQPLPAVLGIDMAGVVVSAGPGVTAFRRGDEVFGMTGGVGGVQGSLAQFAAVDAELLAPKPSNLSLREAASLPLAFITAWEGLVDRAAVRPGDNVLIQGGAGGVGQIVTQLAIAFGARAFAVGSVANHSFLERLGATPIERGALVEDSVARYTQGRGFDVVYDTVGGASLDASFRAVARFGHVVSALGWGTHALAPLSFQAATYAGVFSLLPLLTGEGRAHHGQILREATRLVEAGKVVPRVDVATFSLETLDAAYRALESGTAVGKLVVTIAD